MITGSRRVGLTDFRKRIIDGDDLAGQPERAACWRARELDATFPAEPFAR